MNSIPMFNLGPENQMIVFGRSMASGFGPAGLPPSAALSSSLVSSNPLAPFTGSGATGLRPDQSPMSLREMWDMRSQAKEAKERLGPEGLEKAQYTLEFGLEM